MLFRRIRRTVEARIGGEVAAAVPIEFLVWRWARDPTERDFIDEASEDLDGLRPGPDQAIEIVVRDWAPPDGDA